MNTEVLLTLVVTLGINQRSKNKLNFGRGNVELMKAG